MELIYITLLTILASMVGTLTGFGTSTIMVPILLFFLPLPQTLLLVGIIHWFGSLWKIVLFRKAFQWKLILSFGIAGIITTFIGANIAFSVSETLLSRILGGFLLVYVIFLIYKSKFKLPQKTPVAVTGGALSGFFAGVFGVGGAIRGAFLSAFDLPKAVYLSTAGIIALIIDSTRVSTYFFNGVSLDQKYFWGLLVFIPASLIGAGIAKRIVDKIPERKFRIVISIFLLLVGLKFLIFPN